MKDMLWVCSRVPFPPIGGDRQKSFQLLQILARHFRVHLVLVGTEDFDAEARCFLQKNCASYIAFKRSRFWSALRAVFRVLNGLPLQVNYYLDNRAALHINRLLPSMDLALATLVRTTRYIEKATIPIYLDIVDSIGLNYMRSGSRARSLLWRLIYKVETGRLLRYEEYCVRRFRATCFVNASEAAAYSMFGNVEWIPNGVSPDFLSPILRKPEWANSIVFFGKMDYQPNVDAVVWFAEHVLLLLPQNIRLVIVGACPATAIYRLARQNKRIEVRGFEKDPGAILASAIAVVAPMQTGGGIQNKVLEAMALGAVNILTSLAADPIVGGEHGKHFLVCDSPDDMAEAIIRVQQVPEEFEEMRRSARELVRQQYTWDRYEQRLLAMLTE